MANPISRSKFTHLNRLGGMASLSLLLLTLGVTNAIRKSTFHRSPTTPSCSEPQHGLTRLIDESHITLLALDSRLTYFNSCPSRSAQMVRLLHLATNSRLGRNGYFLRSVLHGWSKFSYLITLSGWLNDHHAFDYKSCAGHPLPRWW